VDYVLINFIDNSAATTCTLQNVLAYLKRLLPWAQDWELLQSQKIAQQLPQLQVQAWQELYPALLSSMRLEKYVMFCVLLLISLVAIMNMIALLIVQVQAKRKDIVMLKVLGFSRYFIHLLFTLFGVLLTALASGTGLLLAAGIGYWFTYYMPLRLPDAYLVAFLPFDLHPANFMLVFVATMLIGLLAAWIPARRAADLHVIEVLKDS
jgi:lipoprotein-releasing system permease protein